jgi:flagella basal body P-ring formation protein FlgA
MLFFWCESRNLIPAKMQTTCQFSFLTEMFKLTHCFKWLIWLGLHVTLHSVQPTVLAAEDLVRDTAARDHLTALARVWVERQLSVTPEQVEIPPLDARLRVPMCANALRFEFPFATRDALRASCDNPSWQAFLRVVVQPPRIGIVAADALPAGHMLTTTDLTTGVIPRGLDGYFGDRGILIGKTLRRAISAGTAVLAADVEDLRPVFRVAQPASLGDTLLATHIRTERISGNAVPRGAVAGDQSIEGARALTNLQIGRILLTSDISLSRRYIVAKQNITAGQAADSVLLEPVVRTAIEGDDNSMREAAGLENLEFSRNISKGEILKKSDLRPALLIRRGQQVLVTVSAVSGLELTFLAEALHDARLNEQIGLKNLESGRIIQGMTTGKGAAKAL